MNNDVITLKIINGIYDIQPPVTPVLSGLETTLLLLSFLLVITAIIYFIWKLFYSRKAKAKRKINKLHIEYSEKNINAHDTIYQLCFILSKGLKLHHLSEDTCLPIKLAGNKKEWASFTKRTSVLRYKNNTTSPSDINKLFTESLYWLRSWS